MGNKMENKKENKMEKNTVLELDGIIWPLVFIVLIIFWGYQSNQDKQIAEKAIEKGLEACKIDNDIIWVKDCEKTIKIYKNENENKNK
jgi:hypothetical protein